MNFEPLVGKWYPEDCTCNPRCHYLFRADYTGYYRETFGSEVAIREFTWEYDGTYLKTISNNPDPGDDGVEIEKIRFEGKDKFYSFSADFDFEETPQNTTVYIRVLE